MRLLAAGHEAVVASWSSGSVEAAVAAGATPADSAAAVTQDAAVVMSALPTVQAVTAVYVELSAVARPGQVYVDHSTMDLATTHVSARSSSHLAASSTRRSRVVPPVRPPGP